jgi:hypothetical protein
MNNNIAFGKSRGALQNAQMRGAQESHREAYKNKRFAIGFAAQRSRCVFCNALLLIISLTSIIILLI